MSEAALTVVRGEFNPVPASPSYETTPITPMAMISQAVANGASMEMIKELRALQKEIEGDAARKVFNAAMAAAQAEIKPVAKNADNSQTKSRYATLDAIDAAISPVITRHGFGTSYDTADSPIEGCYRILCEVTHVGGHSKTYHADVPIDGAGFKGTANKTATHAFASTITYGRRILKMMAFDVTARNAMPDDDGNAAGGADTETITDEQSGQINGLITAKRANIDAFLKYFRVECVPDLPAKALPEALDMLNRMQVRP